jgi:hypothetical protein
VADGTVYICLVPQLGTASGATTDATGYSIGTTTITLASAGTGTILAGDRVQFAGDTASYKVTSGDADVSNGGSITIESPGLLQAIPASTTAITVLNGSITAAFTATAPTWSDSKQGWYGTGGQANYRYTNVKMTKASTSYSGKEIFPIPKISYHSVPYVQNVNSLVKAHLSSDQTYNTATDIVFNTEDIDLGSEYDNTTGIFTATYAGYYEVTLNAGIPSGSDATGYLSLLVDSGSGYTQHRRMIVGAGNATATLTDIVYLDATDKVKFQGDSGVQLDADGFGGGPATVLLIKECPVNIMRP